MDDLTGDYGYVFRELVLARVTCTNVYGYAADFSSPNTEGALIRQLPAAMGSIFVNAFETNPYQITVYWFELATEALKGDSEILSYSLEISTDEVIWSKITGSSTDYELFTETTFTRSNLIEAGKTYSFRILATNVYGDGPYSPISQFKAAQEPAVLDSQYILTTNL